MTEIGNEKNPAGVGGGLPEWNTMCVSLRMCPSGWATGLDGVLKQIEFPFAPNCRTGSVTKPTATYEHTVTAFKGLKGWVLQDALRLH